MASPKWIGNARAVSDVWTLTPGGTIEADDLFIVTINGKSVSTAAGGTTATAVTTAVLAAINALDDDDYPEFAEYTWSGTTTIIATMTETGIPGTITVSTTEAGGGAADAQTFTATHTTTGTGPNNWDNTANWDTGAVPANTDTPIIEDSGVDILYGIDANTVTLTSLEIKSTFTGKIGLPRRNPNGYAEYRETYLKISITTLNVGQGDGNGSNRIKINVGSNACTCNVYGMAAPRELGVSSFLFVGTSASNVLKVTQGSVGVAEFSGESANLSGGLYVGFETNQASDAKVRCGSGTTIATITQTGGTLEVNSNHTTVVKTGGTMTIRGTATTTTLTNIKGTFIDESTGTMTTLNNFATYDRRRVISAKTITNSKVYKGSQTYAPSGTTAPAYGVVFTTATEFHGCAPDDGVTKFSVGEHKKWTFADI